MQKEKTSGEPVRPGKNDLIDTPINPGPNKLISVSRLVDSTKKAGVMRAWLGAAHVIVLLALVSGCRKDVPPAAGPAYASRPPGPAATIEYVFAVNPLHNPVRLYEIYQPMVDLINTQTGDFRLKLEASYNFAAFERKLATRAVHFALPNPYQTLVAEQTGYRVFAKRGDDENFRGIILVRKDSGIHEVSDLKGATISFPSPTALAATMMPKYFLKKHGLDVERDAHPVYVGSQDSAIMNVYQGLAKAGCSWLGPWEQIVREKPEVANVLVVQWITDPLINNSLMVRDDVPEAHWQKLHEILVTFHTNATGLAIMSRMSLTRFDAATSATYNPVRAFLKDYESAFPPQPVKGAAL